MRRHQSLFYTLDVFSHSKPPADYMNYVHNLRDENRPDYQHFWKMFTKLSRKQGFKYDNIFDWAIREL